MRSIALAFTIVLALVARSVGASDRPIEYLLDLNDAHTQTVHVTMVIPDVESEFLDISLPTWRPGRYVILDMAGTIRRVSATDGRGRELEVEKTRKATWRVTTDGADEVRLSYDLYANSINDRTRHADDTHAFLSGSSVFMYLPERRDAPIRVVIDAPEGWRISSGLEPAPGEPDVLLAPDYDILVDSPIEAGIHELIEFDVEGVPHEIVIWGQGEFDRERLAEDFAEIVREQSAIFGDLPYERYVFMIHSGPGLGGGTEHWNSTIMQTRPSSFTDNDRYEGFLGLVAHEMFHTWNVKRLRPQALKPYAYDRENYTKLLWVAEGTTSYYDDLTLVRAALIDVDTYLDRMSGSINSVRTRPGDRIQSLESSSFDAWVKFNKPNPDAVNSTVSFYTKGAVVNMLLDLEIRAATDDRLSLDDVMRDLYVRFPYEGPGFEPEDVIESVERLTGRSFGSFFEQYVRGTDDLPLEPALLRVGLELRHGDKDDEESDEPELDTYVGFSVRNAGGLAEVSRVYADGPAYDAGLIVGDEIVAINGYRLHADDLNDVVEQLEPGEAVRVTYLRRDALRELTFDAAGRPKGSWKLSLVKDPTDQQKALFESWTHQPWPADEDDESDESEDEHGD